MGIDDLIFNAGSGSVNETSDPIEIFNYLDKKDGFGYLRTNQTDFLREWNTRRSEQDIVGVMHTGAGKTLVGLLMLKSKLIEEEKPAIYLCPTVQLVEQTVRQAECYGIDVCKVDSDNRLPIEFLNSEKILITTFSKLFNGRSIFGVRGASSSEIVKIGSILIDDAHSCVDYARQSSTISISRDSDTFKKIFELFQEEIENQSYGNYRAICNSEASVSVRIPYWEWFYKIKDIKEILENHFLDRDVADFEYRMVLDVLKFCRCYVSGRKIEITPKYSPIEKIPSFFNAKHTYILSATINEKDLLEELGIKKQAIENPIITDSYVADVGERMILSPTKYHKNINDSIIRNWIFGKCREHNLGLVVIVPSNSSKAKEEWKTLGAKIVDNLNYEETLERIKSGDREQVVLVNRYEGVDFPGDQAHILILDGLPDFSTNKDRAISIVSQDENWKLKIVQKIEQGLGRTVRSNSDFSVVLLLGDRLVDFVSLKSNIKYFSLATQAQLGISNDIISKTKFETSNDAIKEISKSIGYCLSREPNWVRYAKQRLSKVDITKITSKDISAINKEYESYKKYIREDYEGSIAELKNLVNQKSENKDELGRIYQEEAEVRFYSGDIRNSQNLQKSAFENWDYAFKPQISGYQKIIKIPDVIENSLNFIKDFDDKDSLKKFIDDIIKNMRYSNDSSSELFEKAVENLGKLIGLHSIRPEKIKNDGGPDNLWLSKDFQFIIECKNRETNEISKDDAEQLIHSQQWFINNYGEGHKQRLILFHPNIKKNQDVQPSDNMYIISKEKLYKLKDNIERLKQLLYSNFNDLRIETLHGYFCQCQLNINQFENQYLVRLQR